MGILIGGGGEGEENLFVRLGLVRGCSLVRARRIMDVRYMPINVEWQDERGGNRACYIGRWITRKLPESAIPGSVCVRFIDPYGNTIFNRAQITILEGELTAMVSSVEDVEVRQQCEDLLRFIGVYECRIHMYLKFIGD